MLRNVAWWKISTHECIQALINELMSKCRKLDGLIKWQQISHKANIIERWLLTRYMSYSAWSPQPFLKPNWSFPKYDSAVESSLRVKIFNTVVEYACNTKLMVLKSAQSWALCFSSVGIITKSKRSSGHAPLTYALCGLRGCKNGPAPFPGRMLYKATKPG